MASDMLSQNCGRLFEVGFNCGLLAFLDQQEQAKALTTQGACDFPPSQTWNDCASTRW